jgi:Na+-driven multidrug efflux pump
LFLALVPSAWVGLFNDDPAVLASSSLYFRIAGITFPLSGLAIALGAAAQAAGRPLWPLRPSPFRLLVAVGGSWLDVAGIGGRIEELVIVLALGAVCYCGVMAGGNSSAGQFPNALKRSP